MYKLRAPLFTGLTTYLREPDPFDSISIFGSILFVPLGIRSVLASSPRDETYQTLLTLAFFFAVLLPSSYLFISRVVSFVSHTLTSRRSKRIIKSAQHSMKPFIVFHVAGFIVLAASR